MRNDIFLKGKYRGLLTKLSKEYGKTRPYLRKCFFTPENDNMLEIKAKIIEEMKLINEDNSFADKNKELDKVVSSLMK